MTPSERIEEIAARLDGDHAHDPFPAKEAAWLLAELRAAREALKAAVDLLNSDYLKSACAMAYLHGLEASEAQRTQTARTWERINDALPPAEYRALEGTP